MNFQDRMEAEVAYAQQVLSDFLPKEEGNQKTVLKAMNYSVRAGGKRLRPILMKLSYEMLKGNGGNAAQKEDVLKCFMAALEMIHTYSLVHDDLEAMDNDEYRRGMKTTHVVYGEAMAILAGDGLLNYAFETAAKAFEKEPGSIACERAMMVLGKKAGIYGMVAGQVADIEAEEKNQALSMDELLFIHANKTAALIQAALMIGAILAGAGQPDVMKMEQIGYNVGIAFQIQDDILDVTSTFEELGKPIGSDEKNNKTTYVTLTDLETAKNEVERLSQQAISMLREMPGEKEFLEELLASLIHRNK